MVASSSAAHAALKDPSRARSPEPAPLSDQALAEQEAVAAD